MNKMTREQLESYRSMKEEIQELKCRLKCLGEDDSMIGNSTVFDYRSGYPVPQAVVGVDWEKVYRLEGKYQKKIAGLQEECRKIEEYVEEISDSQTRRIFRMYFLDAIPQNKVAKIVHMSQATVSKKISHFLKME